VRVIDHRIRSARAEDLPRLPAVERSANALVHAADPRFDPRRVLPGERARQSLEEGLLWVATDAADRPVGFLAAGDLQGNLHIEELDVAAEHQRQGLGGALLTVAIERARWALCPAVTLTTDRFHPWNAPFYAGRGFVMLDDARLPPALRARIDAEVAAGHDRARRCAMAKIL
jgi:GNAT superfamily N-acetyltransferase